MSRMAGREGEAVILLPLLFVAAATQQCGTVASEGAPSNFVYFARDHDPMLEAAFLEAPGVDGAQLTYTWRELEPVRGEYDFSEIERRVELLAGYGKRLWIQLSDVTFYDRPPVPEYLLTDTIFHGGAARKREGSEGTFDGWVSRRWDPAVRSRLAALFDALSLQFDGRIEGINTAESAIGFEDPDSTLRASPSMPTLPECWRSCVMPLAPSTEAVW